MRKSQRRKGIRSNESHNVQEYARDLSGRPQYGTSSPEREMREFLSGLPEELIRQSVAMYGSLEKTFGDATGVPRFMPALLAAYNISVFRGGGPDSSVFGERFREAVNALVDQVANLVPRPALELNDARAQVNYLLSAMSRLVDVFVRSTSGDRGDALRLFVESYITVLRRGAGPGSDAFAGVFDDLSKTLLQGLGGDGVRNIQIVEQAVFEALRSMRSEGEISGPLLAQWAEAAAAVRVAEARAKDAARAVGDAQEQVKAGAGVVGDAQAWEGYWAVAERAKRVARKDPARAKKLAKDAADLRKTADTQAQAAKEEREDAAGRVQEAARVEERLWAEDVVRAATAATRQAELRSMQAWAGEQAWVEALAVQAVSDAQAREQDAVRALGEAQAREQDAVRALREARAVGVAFEVVSLARRGRREVGSLASAVEALGFRVRRPLYDRRDHVDEVFGESAGMNRHGGGAGSALRRRGSDPRWPRVMRRRLVRGVAKR